jgi:hypothetical protein
MDIENHPVFAAFSPEVRAGIAETAAYRIAAETARRIDDLAGVRLNGQLVGWMTPTGAFVPVEA